MIGTWGGDHVRMTIGSKSSILAYDCAHGTIDQPFTVDQTGHFTLVGTHVPQTPGPIHEGQVPIAHPALYTGSTNGKTMQFSITLTDTGGVAGPFVVLLGASGHIVQCL